MRVRLTQNLRTFIALQVADKVPANIARHLCVYVIFLLYLSAEILGADSGKDADGM